MTNLWRQLNTSNNAVLQLQKEREHCINGKNDTLITLDPDLSNRQSKHTHYMDDPSTGKDSWCPLHSRDWCFARWVMCPVGCSSRNHQSSKTTLHPSGTYQKGVLELLVSLFHVSWSTHFIKYTLGADLCGDFFR